MDRAKSRLIRMLALKAFKYSADPIFKLVYGKKSCFYVNCKNVTLTAEGMSLVGPTMLDRIPRKAKYVGGLTFGADAIANAISFSSIYTVAPVNSFSIRKEVKDHGVPNWIEGEVPKGAKVVIVDDVVTTGGSIIKAISRAENSFLKVIKIIILVDRQEGGLENIKGAVDVPVEAIITIEELMSQVAIMNS